MTHHTTHWGTVAFLVLAALATSPQSGPKAAAADEKADKLRVYVGTYTDGKSKGIYLFELDLDSGALTSKGVAAEVANPSFLAIHPTHRYLYAVGEMNDFKGKKGGAVSAFAIEGDTGKLELLNQQSSRGSGPCHVVVDRAGKNVLVANYGGGSVASLPIGKDGKLGEATSFVQHKGKGTDPGRQEGPHGHSINLDAANHFAFAADLGLDKVLVYRFDAKKGTLTPNDPPSASVAPRSGPRHFAFHPDGRHAYVINEMANTVTAFDYDAESGVLKEIQTISTLPEGFKGKTWTAEVVVHPSGKFLYGSNRGHDSIAIFTIDSNGKLTEAGHQTKTIKVPRNFAIDPTGRFLLVGNQEADTISVFRVDQKTGGLDLVGKPVEAPKPVCIRMIPMK
ncbi:MAG: lactonase family protein [Planctomycetes bacterium]|nr:lactonase family protein [Planctomycetota bacterium]